MIRALDNYNDWSLSFKTGKEEILQDCETRLREWRNDCFFNRAAGVDYMACFDNADNNRLAIEQIGVMNRTAGIINVSSYEQGLDKDTRKLFVKATITTIYGDEEVNYV